MPPLLSIHAAEQAVRTKAREMLAIADDPNISTAKKKLLLAALEDKLTKAQHDLATAKGVSSNPAYAAIAYAGGSAFGSSDDVGLLGTANGRVPRLALSDAECRSLHEAALSKQTLRLNASTKTPTDSTSLLPATLLPGVVGRGHEPVRLLDHIPAFPMAGPSIEFISHVTTTGAFTTVAHGTLKPELTLGTQSITLGATKIAGWSSVVDEMLQDFPQFTLYLQQELTRSLFDAENTQVLSGDGTGQNLLGLLNWSGILTRPVGTNTLLDTFELSISDLRTGPAHCEPDVIVLNPADWSKTRRSKDGQNRYMTQADPTSAEADSLWGIPVLPTTSMAAGTGLVASFAEGAMAFVRQGVSLEVSNNVDNDFVTNRTRFRCEERIAIGSPRPAALLKVTGI